MAVSLDELRVWSRYIYSIAGISLDDSKGYLIEARLVGLMRETGSASYSELLHKVKADAMQTLRRKVVDAITTGETSFFRDTSPFDVLQHKILPDLIDRRRKTLGVGRTLPHRPGAI
jgi:chemotaxis protein methyltransferase CheR